MADISYTGKKINYNPSNVHVSNQGDINQVSNSYRKFRRRGGESHLSSLGLLILKLYELSILNRGRRN
jgi:hypothetical protein